MPENIETKIDFKGSGFKKYFSNTAWLFVERAFHLFVNFVVGIYVVRYLGTNNNGMLAYAVSATIILMSLSSMGFTKILIRELVKDESKRDKLLGSSTLMNLGVAGFFLILTAIYGLMFSSYQNTIVIIVAISIVFNTLNTIDSFFKAKVQSKYTVYSKLISGILTNTIRVILIIISAELIYFAAAFTLEYILIAIGNIYFYKSRNYKISAWNFDRETGRRLLSDSWPLMFSSIAASIFLRIDEIIMKGMMGASAVGVYDVAVKLSESWFFIPTIITTSLFPAIINAKKRSEKVYLNHLQKLYDLLAWIALSIAVPVSLFSNQIIGFLYGEAFIGAGPVLALYVWAGIPVFLLLGSNQYLVTENFTKIYLWRAVIGMTLNIILNFILIPVYGLMGAAWATLISYSATTFSIIVPSITRAHFYMMIKSILLVNFPKTVQSIYKTDFKSFFNK
ncbi:flippase [Bacteroidota bacterium]